MNITQRGEVPHPKLNVFAARFSMARGLPDFDFDGLGRAASASYHIALRIGLAYSALESLEKAINCRNQIEIESEQISAAFRSDLFKQFFETLLHQGDVQDGERKKLNNFLTKKSEDLRPIVYAIRNSMFHGSLTAHGLGLASSIKRRKILDDLFTEVMLATNNRFTLYVRRMR
jgi:hypothetical protein